jgi:glycerophosphoryl diester phosphodiesterase
MKKYLWIALLSFSGACSNSKKLSTTSTNMVFDKQGHRGCRGLMPENTIPAMIRAIELGVTTLEMDVVISKDKKVVVSHDPYFNENITTTPEGNHLTKTEAAKRLLYTMPYDSIRKYDVGLKPHPLYPKQQKLAVNKPLLTDLLDATEKDISRKDQAIAYNIEIKSTPGGDGVKHPQIEEFVDLVVNAINSKGTASRTTIQSFDPRALQVLHKKYPSFVTSLLIEDDDKRSLEEQLQQLSFTPSIYSPHFSLVTSALLEQCHQKKMKVIPWTVNSTEEMRRLKQMGVDGIITDYPDLFSQL